MDFLKIIDTSIPCVESPEIPAITFPYPLDNFQKYAINAISKGENVLVTAHTGSGKTLVGEYLIAHTLAKGQRVFYTTPIKSLSNQKFHDLKEIYPGQVGILTGDIKFNPDAPIVIMTTEILRNLLYKKGTSTETVGLTSGMNMDGLGAVIFDEVHYINDKSRGRVWEETFVLLPPSIQLVLLSATIQSPEGFASWLGSLKQVPIHLIPTNHRVVPLTHYVMEFNSLKPMDSSYENSLKTVMDNKGAFHDYTYKQWYLGFEKTLEAHDAHKKVVAGREKNQVISQGKVKIKSFNHKLNSCIQMLHIKELLPAIFFIFSRNECEVLSKQVEGTLIESFDSAAVKNIFDFHLSRYKDMLIHSEQYHQLRELLSRGIAYHHSGILPILKEIIEILFAKGLVKVLFCTETFAVGINMPTKTVVFLDYTKFSDSGRRMLHTDEYTQMAGRAGRRGKDTTGTVIYLPRREAATVEEVRKMMTGAKATITSQMDFGYDFLLKALQMKTNGGINQDNIQSNNILWKDILNTSYWYKQQMETKASYIKELEGLHTKKKLLLLTSDEVESLESYYTNKKLLEFAAKDYKKSLQREIETWVNSHMGPRWKNILQEYPKLTQQISSLLNEIEQYDTYIDKDGCEITYEDKIVSSYIHFLQKIGFLSNNSTLTNKGVYSTEINECHPILLAECYSQNIFENLTEVDIIGLLSAFAKDGERQDNNPSIKNLDISPSLRSALEKLKDMNEYFCKVEHECGIPYSSYWDLSTNWIEIGVEWICAEQGGSEQRNSSMPVLCKKYGIFEGNFYKYIMTLSNMLNELISIATLASNTVLLYKLQSIQGRLMPQGVMPWSESLYLRI